MATKNYFVTLMVQLEGENESAAVLEVCSQTIHVTGKRSEVQQRVLDASLKLFDQLTASFGGTDDGSA